jgi:hypothetical protein
LHGNPPVEKTMPWADGELLPRDRFQDAVRLSLLERQPLLVGKIGANELQLLYWTERLKLQGRSFTRRHVHFWNLRTCASNAGLKPRTRSSYRQFGVLLRKAALAVDHLGVWQVYQDPAERTLYRHLGLTCEYHNLFHLCPWFADPACAWPQSLAGRKLFVVSPFLESILAQYPRREQIWAARPGLLPDCQISGYRFPYLISRDCTLSWQEVYAQVAAMMRETDFDVALLGCGALGLPLGLLAKQLGRHAIHMGGFLQVLFGIHGSRFRQDQAYAELFNQHWIAPADSETPMEAKSIENGCYW